MLIVNLEPKIIILNPFTTPASVNIIVPPVVVMNPYTTFGLPVFVIAVQTLSVRIAISIVVAEAAAAVPFQKAQQFDRHG